MRCALLALLLAAPLSGAADWPVFRGDARMTGVVEAKLPDRLEEVWEFQCKDGVDSAPAVAGDRVFVASLDKHLYALDLATGKEVWKVELGTFRAPPAVHKGRVYVGDMNGKFYAVDAATGKKLWAFETGAEIHAGANFVGDDVLIGSHDSTLYRLDAAGGKVWEFKIDGPINGAAAVVGERTFVAGCDSLFHVVDTATGKSLGSVDIGGQAAATAAVSDDTAYVGTMTNQVVSINWKTLKKGWTFEAKGTQQPFYASAALTDKFVVTASRGRKVHAIERESGKEAWNFRTEHNVDASPVVAGGRVYVGCLSTLGDFYVLDLATGRQIQQLELGSPVGGSCAVAGGTLVVGTDKGRVVKLGAKK